MNAKPLASSFSKLIVTSETIQQIVMAAQKNNFTSEYIRENVGQMWAKIEDEHYYALSELLSFLPYLMVQTSTTYIAFLVVAAVAFPPFLIFFAYILFSVGLLKIFFSFFRFLLNKNKISF